MNSAPAGDTPVAELERGVVDVDLLEVRLSRAVEIVEELDRRIRGAKNRVETILPRLESFGRGAAADTPSAGSTGSEPPSGDPDDGPG